ncbi:MAG: prolyl oligopeptidase family serine peptidase [Chitinophagales bacterium]
MKNISQDLSLLEDIQHPNTLAYLQQKNAEIKVLKEGEFFKRLQEELFHLRKTLQRTHYNYLGEDHVLLFYENSLAKKYFNGRLEKIISRTMLTQTLGKRIFSFQSHESYISLLADATGQEGNSLYLFPENDFETKILIDKNVKHYSWRGMSEIFYMKTAEGSHRPSRLFRYEISHKKQTLICEESNENIWMSVGVIEENVFLHRNDLGKKQSISLFELETKTSKLLFENKTKFITTFNGTHSFTHLKDTIYQDQKPIFTVPPYTALKSFEVKGNLLVLLLKVEGIDEIAVYNFQENQIIQRIHFDSKTASLRLAESVDKEHSLFYVTDYLHPEALYQLDLRTFEYKPLFEEELTVEHPFKDVKYQTDLVYALSHDSKKIPISLFYNTETLKEAGNPIYIQGYGAYGLTILQNGINPVKKALLDRGIIWACIHTRGGGECGHLWHEEGRRLNKKNTFEDFISGINHLIKLKLADPNKIAITSGSAGAMLAGYVLNNCDLVKVAIMQMPYLDVLRTMRDASLVGTAHHYLELGNPTKHTSHYDYIKSYCPIQNICPKKYPNILITSAAKDIRVQYWQAAKYAVKIEAQKTNRDTEFLLHTHLEDIGHFGVYTGEIGAERTALEYAFLLKHLGLIS